MKIQIIKDSVPQTVEITCMEELEELNKISSIQPSGKILYYSYPFDVYIAERNNKEFCKIFPLVTIFYNDAWTYIAKGQLSTNERLKKAVELNLLLPEEILKEIVEFLVGIRIRSELRKYNLFSGEIMYDSVIAKTTTLLYLYVKGYKDLVNEKLNITTMDVPGKRITIKSIENISKELEVLYALLPTWNS